VLLDELDPVSIPGEVYVWPPPGMQTLNQTELAAGRSGLGPVRERRGQLAQVRAKGNQIRPWVVTWGAAALDQVPKFSVGDNPAALRSQGAAFLELNWGTRAARHTAFIDWGAGGQTQVVGSYVQTTLVLPNVVAEGGYIPGDGANPAFYYEPNTYFSSIVPGTIGVRSAVQKTQVLGVIAVAGEGFCSIPPFARRAMVIANSSSLTVSNYQVNMYNAGNQPAGVAPQRVSFWNPATVAYQGQHMQRAFWFPIPIDACYCGVIPAGVNQQSVRIVFELAL
jgi:hypothetical protein